MISVDRYPAEPACARFRRALVEDAARELLGLVHEAAHELAELTTEPPPERGLIAQGILLLGRDARRVVDLLAAEGTTIDLTAELLTVGSSALVHLVSALVRAGAAFRAPKPAKAAAISRLAAAFAERGLARRMDVRSC